MKHWQLKKSLDPNVHVLKQKTSHFAVERGQRETKAD
jgi:hypothetical protein